MAGHIKSTHENFDIASLDIREPIAESAMLARQWSETLCTDCAPYHGAWQVLHLLGVLNSMRSDDSFLIAQLDAAIASGASRILVSGAADYALQARIAAVANKHNSTIQLTIVDRCETPLELNRWYATRTGMNVELLRENILNYRATDKFDLICTHAFLPYFSPGDRIKLAKIWWDCLRPGGTVLTAQRAKPDDTSDHRDFPQQAFKLAAEQQDQIGIDPELARSLAVNFAAARRTFKIKDNEEIRKLFLQQGFELEQFVLPDSYQPEKQGSGTHTQPNHCRLRILARKPVV